jgi:benzoylformate decarboxylase
VHLAELIGAKVFTTSYARMNFPSSHPQFMGRINPVLPASRKLLSEGDVVLAVGTNVSSGFFYFSGRSLSPATKLIHIDSAYNEIAKSDPIDVGIIADPKIALRDLTDAVGQQMSSPAREAAHGRITSLTEEKAAVKRMWERRLKEQWDMRPMSVERMMTEIARALPSNAIIADDSLSSKDALHGAMEFNQPDSIFGERVGAIGWGMGSTMGIKLARPDRPVVGIIGDGSAMMTIQALWTAANASIPVVYLICNNRSYRILKLNMNIYKTQVLGEPPPEKYIGMDFSLPLNIAGIASAIGVYGRSIEYPAELGPALREALELGRAAVLDVVIDGSI